MLDPSAGWALLPRALEASEFWHSLSAEQRVVVLYIQIILPAFHDTEGWFAGSRFPVPRGSFFHSEDTIAERAGTTRKVVRGVLLKMQALGLIVRRRVHPSGRCPHITTVRDYVASQMPLGQRTGQKEANNGPVKGQRRASGERSRKEEKKERRDKDTCEPSAEALRVFGHWDRVMGKPKGTQFSPKRRRAVLQRLRDGFTVEQLCQAIDGCARSPFHMGENDRRKRFDDLELICRDVEHVEGFLEAQRPSHDLRHKFPPESEARLRSFSELMGEPRG